LAHGHALFGLCLWPWLWPCEVDCDCCLRRPRSVSGRVTQRCSVIKCVFAHRLRRKNVAGRALWKGMQHLQRDMQHVLQGCPPPPPSPHQPSQSVRNAPADSTPALQYCRGSVLKGQPAPHVEHAAGTAASPPRLQSCRNRRNPALADQRRSCARAAVAPTLRVGAAVQRERVERRRTAPSRRAQGCRCFDLFTDEVRQVRQAQGRRRGVQMQKVSTGAGRGRENGELYRRARGEPSEAFGGWLT